MKVLITGAAGFIGFHLSKYLMKKGYKIIGLDNLNNYYDVSLKKNRLKELNSFSDQNNTKFNFENLDIVDKERLNELFKINNPNYVVHLAAQAGVRYSLINPSAYIQSNLVGFGNILESCREFIPDHFVYASSSSVYGGNMNLPFKEFDNNDHPISLYAATKKSNELVAHTYSHLYSLPSTGLRFFTVYGPWGRPDMALFIFTKSILEETPINVFNNGNMMRDFTYIDDIVESIYRVMKKPATKDMSFDPKRPNPATSWAPHRVFNIGNSKPENLMDYILAIEECLGIEAKKIFLPIQPGDVVSTASDTSLLEEWIKFKPQTSIKKGVRMFIKWYREYYRV